MELSSVRSPLPLSHNVPNLSLCRSVCTKAVKIQERKIATLCTGVCALARILLPLSPLSSLHAQPSLYYVTGRLQGIGLTIIRDSSFILGLLNPGLQTHMIKQSNRERKR